MGTKGTTSYRIGDQNALHYITIATVGWVDLFTRRKNNELFTIEVIGQKLNYIHQNPVEEGIVHKPEDYLYSSARNYAELESVLEIVLL